MRGRVAFVVAAVLACALPPIATGATAYVSVGIDGRFLHYTAGPGEMNQVELTEAGGTVTIRDPGAVITAGSGCTSVNDHAVQCTSSNDTDVTLGDLDDTATVAVSADVSGGTGNDEITLSADFAQAFGDDGDDLLTAGGNFRRLFLHGGTGSDTITGGSAFDEMHGGPGDDTLMGGGDQDFLFPGGGIDNVDGGPGRDAVWYEYFAPPVTVDLRTGQASGQGQDTLVSIQDVYGTRRADLLIGDGNPNFLNGGEGADVLRGGSGSDSLYGGFETSFMPGGEDRLWGGSGKDRLQGGRGDDLLVGGPGHDILEGEHGDDRFGARDQTRDIVRGGIGRDSARIDRGLDYVIAIEHFL